MPKKFSEGKSVSPTKIKRATFGRPFLYTREERHMRTDEDIAVLVEKWIAKFRPHLHPKDVREGIISYLKNASWFLKMGDLERVRLVGRVETIIRQKWAKKAQKTRKAKEKALRREKAQKAQLQLI